MTGYAFFRYAVFFAPLFLPFAGLVGTAAQDDADARAEALLNEALEKCSCRKQTDTS